MLKEIVEDFSVCVSNAEEIADMTNPTDGVKTLSQIKANSVFNRICARQNENKQNKTVQTNNIQNDSIKNTVKKNNCSKSNGNRNTAQNKTVQKNDNLQNKSDLLVIGADTIVVLNDKVLGKPKDEKQARETLLSLSGKTHKVITGVTIKTSAKTTTFAEETLVTFKKLDESEITEYIKTGSPFDKAGAYGIQDSDFVVGIQGSYKNVMGLPVERLSEILQTYGG